MYNFLTSCQIIYCFTLISFILFPNIQGNTSSNYSQHRAKREDACSQHQFRCKSDNKCVDRFVKCDGVKDCADGSDETVQLCSGINCPGYSFRCNYGACIDSTAKCDGRIDCVDSSDETDLECPPLINEASPSKHCNGSRVLKDEKLLVSSFRDVGAYTVVHFGKENSDHSFPLQKMELENFYFATVTLEMDSSILTSFSESEINVKQSRSNQFGCVSGHCIDQKLACNGKRDCDDGTDETIKNCENNKCTKSQFRCGYGACIDLKLKCDGVKHCPDGSDEFSEMCKPTHVTPTPKPTPAPVTESSTPGSCTLPPASPDKKFTVQCPDSKNCNHQPGKKVPKYTEASFKCNPGYQHEGPEPFVSICSNGVWLPPIANCDKICKTLKPKNVDLVCYRKGTDVDCEGTLVAGTTVRPRCKPQHHEEYPVYYRDITCQADGEWTNPLFACAPECGKPYANVTKLIAYGTPEKYGDSPWHVAIYDTSEKDKPLICGGTIVSPQLIISAAHCFYDEFNQTPQKIGRFEIVVSKVSRNYTTKDNGLTKYYKIREIFYSNKGYTGTSTNYASDIVIIWLAEKISLSRGVLPACIRWTDNGPFNPGESTPGKLVGWGLDEKGNPSEILLTANLPYISYAKCVETANPDFKGSITLDKFCAGTKTGAGARQGDSGGGLLYRDANTGLYYLQGIVSIKDPTETSIAAFTDVAQYIDWINEIKKQVENEALERETSLSPKT